MSIFGNCNNDFCFNNWLICLPLRFCSLYLVCFALMLLIQRSFKLRRPLTLWIGTQIMMEVFHLVHDVQKLIHSGHLHHVLLYCLTYIPLKIKSHIVVIQFITISFKPIFIILFNVFTLLYIFKTFKTSYIFLRFLKPPWSLHT